MVIRDESLADMPARAASVWEAIQSNNVREAYRLIVVSDVSVVNTDFDSAFPVISHHHVDARESNSSSESTTRKRRPDPATCERIVNSDEPGNCLQGCSLLHLACHARNLLMIELLLQFGADVNWRDFHGRTPLHHCISSRENSIAKFLLRRYIYC